MNMNAIKHNDRKIKPPEMAVKGLFKGFRYITQIFDEEKDQQMQIGLPTDVKHVAHIGSDGPAANPPSWMSDFKPQENENGQVVSRGDTNKEQVGEGVGLQELLPPPEKEKQIKHHKKTRRKSESLLSQKSSESLADIAPKPSRRHHRTRHESIDGNDPSIRRRRVVPTTEAEGSYPLSDGGSHHSKKSSSRRKLKGSTGGEVSMRKSKGKTESGQSVDSSCKISFSDKD